MGKLNNQVALITGAGSGIGEAIARLFAEEGAAVAIADINEEAAKRVAASLDYNALAVIADVSKPEDAQRMVVEAVEAFGGLSILVNNAAARATQPVVAQHVAIEDWQLQIDVTLTGAFLASKFALPELLKHHPPGVIVNIGSVNGIVAFPGQVAYCVAKAGVVHLTRVLAVEYSNVGVRVNCVLPGTIGTPPILSYIENAPDPEDTKRWFELIHPIGRIGRPEEVAKAAFFLVSDDASYITGASLLVDGGFTA